MFSDPIQKARFELLYMLRQSIKKNLAQLTALTVLIDRVSILNQDEELRAGLSRISVDEAANCRRAVEIFDTAVKRMQEQGGEVVVLEFNTFTEDCINLTPSTANLKSGLTGAASLVMKALERAQLDPRLVLDDRGFQISIVIGRPKEEASGEEAKAE